jgi:hypothetical protein
VSGYVAGVDPGVGEIVLASAFLDPLPERLERLRQAAQTAVDWAPVPLLLESHGVLVLARRNLALAGVEPPETIRETLTARERVLREIDLRFRLTLERFLRQTDAIDVEVTLLKGASLALDLYPESALRSQGDLDLLVRPRDVRRALGAGTRGGFFVGERALPVWWYRLAHFHVKLTPESLLLREVELHWALHHPSRLLTVRLERLLSRRVSVDIAGVRAWTLDPLDRFLHLVTHLKRHLEEAPLHPGRAALAAACSVHGHPIRLRWVLDIAAEVERFHVMTDPVALGERAREWNADSELAAMLAWLRGTVRFAPGAAAWLDRAIAALGSPAASYDDNRTSRSIPGSDLHLPDKVRTRPLAAAGGALGHGPLPALDFRTAALARLPRWILPPRRYFERRGAWGVPVASLTLQRGVHAAGVLLHALVALGAFPVALVAGVLASPVRRRVRRRARAPERVLDLVVDARALARRREHTADRREAKPPPVGSVPRRRMG